MRTSSTTKSKGAERFGFSFMVNALQMVGNFAGRTEVTQKRLDLHLWLNKRTAGVERIRPTGQDDPLEVQQSVLCPGFQISGLTALFVDLNRNSAPSSVPFCLPFSSVLPMNDGELIHFLSLDFSRCWKKGDGCNLMVLNRTRQA